MFEIDHYYLFQLTAVNVITKIYLLKGVPLFKPGLKRRSGYYFSFIKLSRKNEAELGQRHSLCPLNLSIKSFYFLGSMADGWLDSRKYPFWSKL